MEGETSPALPPTVLSFLTSHLFTKSGREREASPPMGAFILA